MKYKGQTKQGPVVTYKVFTKDYAGRKLMTPNIMVSIDGSKFASIQEDLLKYTPDLYNEG